jgi:hypothetical protein
VREADVLEIEFNERLRSGLRLCIEITDLSLILGAGTQLARMTRDGQGVSRLASGAEQARLFALLSIVQQQPISANKLHGIAVSLDDWQRGEKSLAHIRLAQASLPYIDDVDDAYRLFLAETLLDQGMTPRALMKALGLDASLLDLIKYDPDQPRVPAGNGRDSGRWGPGGGGSSQAFLAPAAGAARTFLADASPSLVRSLAAFASRFSVPTAVLGALFIPRPNSGGVTEGTLPDAPDIRFKEDGPAGTLYLTAKAADGSYIFIRAQNRGGLYIDVRTGEPVGRSLGGQLYLDGDAVHDAIHARLAQGQEIAPDTRLDSKEDEPKLCPAPEPDTPHEASDRAKDYEDDVHARVNPLAPIPRGFGVNLPDPRTGEIVYFDDCFRDYGDLVDGDMHKGDIAEAKGPRYAYLLSRGFGEGIMQDLIRTAQKQKAVADDRGVGLKWYFAEQSAADAVRERFEKEGLESIVISHMPPKKRK